MSATTSIEWTDATWPVLAGCKETSPGCANCYSARLTATRLKGQPKYRGLAVIGQNGHPRFTGESRLWREHLDWPLRWKTPRRVFVANMSDLFYEGVTDQEIAEVFAVMALAPQHTFQVLTKRAERMRAWFHQDGRASHDIRFCVAHAMSRRNGHRAVPQPDGLDEDAIVRVDAVRDGPLWPLPNVWLGVSCENQATADERIPHLLATPAAVHFLSCEPLLGPIDLTRIGEFRGEPLSALAEQVGHVNRPAVGWVIVGGESGPRARPTEIEHAESVVAQCREAGVPVFCKQLGANPMFTHAGIHAPVALRDRAGRDLNEWPQSLRVRQFPRVPTTAPKGP